mmetsp:Transcript_8703/g.34287  ORF Transcript_8703/g.34287 Transcript_8703/m.34287 type:complete len:522 (+) Transcript_8703:1091-2656(+)
MAAERGVLPGKRLANRLEHGAPARAGSSGGRVVCLLLVVVRHGCCPYCVPERHLVAPEQASSKVAVGCEPQPVAAAAEGSSHAGNHANAAASGRAIADWRQWFRGGHGLLNCMRRGIAGCRAERPHAGCGMRVEGPSRLAWRCKPACVGLHLRESLAQLRKELSHGHHWRLALGRACRRLCALRCPVVPRKGHCFDEAHLHPVEPSQGGKGSGLALRVAPQRHGVDFDAAKPPLARELVDKCTLVTRQRIWEWRARALRVPERRPPACNGGQEPNSADGAVHASCRAASQRLETGGHESVEGDVGRRDARSHKPCDAAARERQRVGRHCKVFNAGCARDGARHGLPVRPQERLASSEPHARHSPLGNGFDHGQNLVAGEQPRTGAQRNTVQRHAVGAAEGAALGQGHAQVGMLAPEPILQRAAHAFRAARVWCHGTLSLCFARRRDASGRPPAQEACHVDFRRGGTKLRPALAGPRCPRGRRVALSGCSGELQSARLGGLRAHFGAQELESAANGPHARPP